MARDGASTFVGSPLLLETRAHKHETHQVTVRFSEQQIEPPATPPPSQPQQTSSILTAVKVSGAAMAAIYGTGFLISLTHAGRLGLRDGELFKPIYVLVGALYWLIPILFGLPTFAWLGIFLRSKKKTGQRPAMTLGGLLTNLQFLMLLFVVTLVAPPGFLAENFSYIFWNLMLSAVGLGGIYVLLRRLRLADTYGSENLFWRSVCRLSTLDCRFRSIPLSGLPDGWRVVRWMLLAGVLAIDLLCLHPLFPLLLRMAVRAKVPIIIFIFSGHLIYQFWSRVQRASDPQDKRALWLVGGAMLIGMYLFSVLGFAYAIYPFIPAERGGGNYEHSPSVVLSVLDEDKTLPPELVDTRTGKFARTIPLKLLEQTSAWIYVAAQPSSPPPKWKPRIVAIPRNAVNMMKFKEAEEPYIFSLSGAGQNSEAAGQRSSSPEARSR
jgi:hypothetical protein